MGSRREYPEDVDILYEYIEEKRLVEAVCHDDKTAFRKIFDAYYNPLLRFSYRYVESKAVAEELVQDLFLWIWENRATWEVEGKLKTYLFRAIKFRAIDHYRSKRTRSDYLEKLSYLEDPYIDPTEIEEEGESAFVKATQQAIEELPDRPRTIYKLSRLEGLTYNEIAEVLEISPKTVETHMSRALDILREQLSQYLPVV